MSKYLRVNDSDYKLTVKTSGTSGTIILDSGNNLAVKPGNWAGGVIVTGDLLVLGTSTTVSTVNMTVQDNIITLNKGESSSGVSEGAAGIEIDRGIKPMAKALFDESILYRTPSSAELSQGAFVFKDTTNKLIGLRTNVIDTAGGDLLLIGSTQGGTGVISVSGTADYESRVIDDDHIPNKKWVLDYATEYFASAVPRFIKQGNSILDINDNEDSSQPTLVLKLNDVVTDVWSNAYYRTQSIIISNNKIHATDENADLSLSGNGTGSVTIESVLKISTTSTDPEYNLDSTRLYVKTDNFDYQTNNGVKHCGGSGIFFVNAENVRDELVSRRKALAFSMIF